MLQRFECFERGISVSVREAIVSMEEVLPSAPSIALGCFQYLNGGRAFTCGSVQLLVQEVIVILVEIGSRPGDVARANRMLDRCLPSLGSIILHKIVPKSNPRSRLAVEFGKLDLIGCALQCLRKLGDGGVWEGVLSTSVWAPLLLEPWATVEERSTAAADRVRSYTCCSGWLCIGVRRLANCGD